MILRFAVQNYRSICSRQEISLVPSNFDGNLSAVGGGEEENTRALKVAAIFGANASGKTTLLRAFRFFSQAVRSSHTHWQPDQPIPYKPFAFAKEREPSVFELEFALDGVRYIYGFSTDDKQIHEEYLSSFPGKREAKLFVRSEDGSFSYGTTFKGNKKLIESTVRKNSLFLSAAAQNNHKELTPIFTWIAGWNSIGSDRRADLHMTMAFCQEESFKKLALPLLRAADLGVVDFRITKPKSDKKSKAIFEALVQAAEIKNATFEDSPFAMPTLSLLHKGRGGRQIPFSSANESNGTVAYFSLLGRCILAFTAGEIVFVDELDASLHPNLARNLVLLFNSSENTSGAQLVFNTHDVTMLDGDLLRRDQVWFTEKDDDGATGLYPLTDYKPRKEENLMKGYLTGKFGGIPYLGDFYSILKEMAEHGPSSEK